MAAGPTAPKGASNRHLTMLAVAVTLGRGGDGWSGSIDSPVQGAEGLPLTGIEAGGRDVSFAIGASESSPTFRGAMSEDGLTLRGTFTQGPASFPFHLERVADGARLSSPVRPQEPRRPFPYDEREVSYRNEGAGITLAGTLTLPPAPPGPRPSTARWRRRSPPLRWRSSRTGSRRARSSVVRIEDSRRAPARLCT